MAFALTSSRGQQKPKQVAEATYLCHCPSVNAPLAPENNKPRLEATIAKLGNDVSEAGGVRSSFLPQATVSHFCLLFAVRWTGSASLTTSTGITRVSRVNMREGSNCEMRTFRVKISVDIFFYLSFTCETCKMHVFRACFTCEIHVMCVNFDPAKTKQNKKTNFKN